MQTEAYRVNGNDGSDGVAGSVGASPSPFGTSGSKGSSTDTSRPSTGGRATDSARVARFKKELAAPSVNLGMVLYSVSTGFDIFFRCTPGTLCFVFFQSSRP